MIDIYDEVGYIKTVLQDGLSEKWERDATLLTRYYKSQGEKKSEVKKKLKEKCEHSRNFVYQPYVMYKRLNKVIDNAWKKEVPLREIREIVIPREVVDWFLNLEESVVLTDEKVQELKEKRPKVTIKNHVMNWQRTKYLFTLYIWTKVQEHYLDKPNMHYLKQYYKRFKEDADLKTSFNMQRERDLLYDLGYIYVNFALGIDATFIRDNDVFRTPITDKNKVVLKGEDLYKCGYWLEKQKMGSFICQNCGKEFAHYSKSKQEMGRKYCKECAELIKYRVSIEDDYKEIICIDCGEVVKVDKKDTRTCRCEDCQKNNIREIQKIWVARKRKRGVSNDQLDS